MPKTNGSVVVVYSILLLVSSSIFSHKFVAFGSPVREQSFARPDPLRHFKLYKGGYDIRNKHYWASAAFTGVHGYAIAGVWILCGLGFGSYMLLKNFNGSSSTFSENSSDSTYSCLIMFLLVVLFSFVALVATGLAIAANQSSFQRTKKLKETVLGAGEDARKTIQKVTEAMNQMQKLLLPYEPKTCDLLNSTSRQLGRESRVIRNFGRKNERSINKAIQISYIANLVVVSVDLAFLVAAIVVLLLLHWQPGFFIIILFCWIIITLCWVLTGFDFFFHTFAEDTCSALENFQQNPQNNSLSSVLPCSNSSLSDRILVEIGFTVHTFITEINLKIAELNRFIRLDEQTDDSLGVQKICNPFSSAPYYSYAPEKCSNDSTPIGVLPSVLSKFTCYQENTGECKSNRKFIPEASYVMALSYSCAIQDLINIFPDLQSLIQCSFVKDTFSNVLLHQCKPFRVATRRLWLSLLSLSIIMVVLDLLWIGKAHQDRGKSFSICSIFPKHII